MRLEITSQRAVYVFWLTFLINALPLFAQTSTSQHTQDKPSAFTQKFMRAKFVFWDYVGKTADWAAKGTSSPTKLRIQPKQSAFVMETFYSFEQFMNLMQSHPRWGYYTSKSDQIPRDFSTYPEMLSPYFGQMVAEQAFRMWKTLRKHHALGEGERFTVLEMGGGSGRLAYDFLNHCFQLSQKNSSWNLFYRYLHYVINDISPSMIAQQKAKMKGTPWAHQFETILGDIRDPKTTQPVGKIKGFIFANELLDDFGAHKIRVLPSRAVEIGFVVPVMSFQHVQELRSKGLPQSLQIKIQADDKHLRTQLSISSWRRGYYLSKENLTGLIDFLYSTAFTGVIRNQLNQLQFQEIYLPAREVYAIDTESLQEGTLFLESLNQAGLNVIHSQNQADVTIYTQVGVSSLCQSLEKVLDVGYLLFIDYGHSLSHILNSKHKAFQIRTYPDGAPTPYKDLTEKNITADVNFTHLYQSLIRSGFEPLYYAPQKSLQDQTSIILKINPRTTQTTQQMIQSFNHPSEDPFHLLLAKKGSATPPYFFSQIPNLLEKLGKPLDK